METSRFTKGDTVVRLATNEIGRVDADPQLEAGEFWYRIRFHRRVEQIVEEDLAPLDEGYQSLQSLAAEGRWGRLRAVRCALGFERLHRTNRSTIYAFQSQRILFQPYQYKPLLKILDALDRRILVADEVGLGKTIEAGLIMTELAARKPLERVLVVVPSRLRDKWRNELNSKFDQAFEILDRQGFLEKARLASERPGRSALRAIVSMQTMRSEECRDALHAVLGQVDMVIVDEAHHARNANTSVSELLRDLCAVGDCVVLLTATPIHLKNEDLFTLLSALRPTEFINAHAFDRQLQRFAGVHRAAALVRTQEAAKLPEASTILQSIFVDGVAPELRDPLAEEVLARLADPPPDDRPAWASLERQVVDLHPLNSVITRTKKRDVLEHAPVRRAAVYKCAWTDREERAYEAIVGHGGSRGWPSGRLSIGQIQRARQAASCLPAALARTEIAANDDEGAELCDILPSELDGEEQPGAPSAGGTWSGADTKYEKLASILEEIWAAEPAAKVLIFTYFRGTAHYLETRLNDAGLVALRIAGDVPSDPRRPEFDERGRRLRQFEEDPDCRVMISTEVGSEGLDFQFCHHVVNYDLPWNPMTVEQRIGRIDRFGQQSEVVHIHNLVMEGTVEDRILARLYQRIGIFEASIGSLEAILGNVISNLQRDYIYGRLTPAEADERVKHAAAAIDRQKQDLETLERNAANLLGHEEFIRDEMNRVRNLGRFVSEESLLAMITTYLEAAHPSVRVGKEADGVYAMRLTPELRRDLNRVSGGDGAWRDRSRDGLLRFTMRGDLAWGHAQLDLVNTGHPLVELSVEALRKQLEPATARIGAAELVLDGRPDLDLDAGDYLVALYGNDIFSIRTRRTVDAIGWRLDAAELMDAESAERLLYLAIEYGAEWSAAESPSPAPTDVWEAIESEARRRNRRLRQDEDRENKALYLRRLSALTAEHEHDLAQKQRRMRTAEWGGHKGIVRAFEGQIAKAEAEFERKKADLTQAQDVRVALSECLAICAVRVVPAPQPPAAKSGP